jgi:hypothetical protein
MGMSRSFRHRPFAGITTSDSEKKDKQIEHRAERAAVRESLSAFREPDLRPRGQYWDKDGKMRFDPKKYPEMLRK